ncbi:MAG TPA: hypothetical protein DD733_08630 [Clostridiales bacterium]|mgnify:FL=1|nr:hypothetical protein [Clostridiales bacterium]
MMKMMKSRRSAMMMSNIAGMITGLMLGFVGACFLHKVRKNQKSLKNRAKKAFKTIENTISL